MVLLTCLHTATTLRLVKLSRATLVVPSHFILFPGLLEVLETVEILHSDQLAIEVLVLELVV